MFRRVADHNGNDKRSAIFDHLHHCVHCQNSNFDNNFKVLKRCARGELYSLESMLIEKEKPKLNTQLSKSGKIVQQFINLILASNFLV